MYAKIIMKQLNIHSYYILQQQQQQQHGLIPLGGVGYMDQLSP